MRKIDGQGVKEEVWTKGSVDYEASFESHSST